MIPPAELGTSTSPTWTVPRPAGDDRAPAVRRVAATLRSLAEEVDRSAARLVREHAVASRRWTGTGERAAAGPLEEIVRASATVRDALAHAAGELEVWARALEHADERHHSGWRTVLAVGAVVAVSAVAVTVTVSTAGAAVGGAALVEAATIDAAAAEIATATATASSAGAAAVEGVALAARAVRAVQALRAIVVPRLYLAGLRLPASGSVTAGALGGAGWVAASDLADGRPVRPVDLLAGAGLGALGGAATTSRPRPATTLPRPVGPLPAVPSVPAPRTAPHLDVPPLAAPVAAPPRPPLPLPPELRSAGARAGAIERAVTRGPVPVGRPFSMSARQEETKYREHHEALTTQRDATWPGAPAGSGEAWSGNYNRATGRLMRARLEAFVQAPATQAFSGTYHRQPALFYSDIDDNLLVMCRPDGTFWSFWRLSQQQFAHLWTTGRIGGSAVVLVPLVDLDRDRAGRHAAAPRPVRVR